MSFSPSAFLTSNLSGSSSAKSRPVKFAMSLRSYCLSKSDIAISFSGNACMRSEMLRIVFDIRH